MMLLYCYGETHNKGLMTLLLYLTSIIACGVLKGKLSRHRPTLLFSAILYTVATTVYFGEGAQ